MLLRACAFSGESRHTRLYLSHSFPPHDQRRIRISGASSGGVEQNLCIPAQCECIYIEPSYKSLPFCDLYTAFDAERLPVSDNRDIRGSAAHVDYDRALLACHGESAHRTGGRAAQECLYRMEGGVIRGHEVSVAAHDEKRQIQMELCKDMSHCSEKLIYDRDEAGVEKRPCAPSEYIPVKTDQDQPAVTPFPLDTCICGKGGGEGERPAGTEQILRKKVEDISYAGLNIGILL